MKYFELHIDIPIPATALQFCYHTVSIQYCPLAYQNEKIWRQN
jgi:hypothetical protein